MQPIQSSGPVQGVASDRLREEIRQRMGTCPSFFTTASASPAIQEALWKQTEVAYLDNPLPALFKEKLLTYLSRFCAAPYCLARHAAFLLGRGHIAGDAACERLTPGEVLDLVQHPLPNAETLKAALQTMATTEGPLADWPEPGSALEGSLLSCSIPLFLGRNFTACAAELRRLLGDTLFDQLILLLGFARTAHFWTETHPDLGFDLDVQQLLEEQTSLAEWIDAYPERVGEELARQSGDELAHLQVVHAALQKHFAGQTRELRSLAKVFTDSANAIFIKDLDGTVTDMNRAAERQYGWPREELIGQSIKRLVPPRDHAERDDLMARCARGEDVHSVEASRVTRDGTVLPVLLTLSLLSDDDGNPSGFAVISEDISELKAAQDDLRNLSSELALAEERERRRIAGELHDELGQTLTMCLNELELVSRESLTTGGVASVAHLRDMLDRAVTETRELTFELSSPLLHTLGLAAALEQLCHDLEKDHPLSIVFSDDGQQKALSEANRVVFFRCVRELLINVIRHAQATEAYCMLSLQGWMVRAEVYDNGIGFQVGAAGQRFSPEGGFGLFNMREYVHHVGGNLTLAANPEGGSRVILEVPRLPADQHASSMGRAEDVAG